MASWALGTIADGAALSKAVLKIATRASWPLSGGGYSADEYQRRRHQLETNCDRMAAGSSGDRESMHYTSGKRSSTTGVMAQRKSGTPADTRRDGAHTALPTAIDC